MINVNTPNPPTEMSAIRRRPTLSLKWPKIAAPIGRPINAATNTIALSNDAVLAETPFAWKYSAAGASATIGRYTSNMSTKNPANAPPTALWATDSSLETRVRSTAPLLVVMPPSPKRSG